MSPFLYTHLIAPVRQSAGTTPVRSTIVKIAGFQIMAKAETEARNAAALKAMTAREGALVPLPGERTPAALHLRGGKNGGCETGRHGRAQE